MLSFGIVCCYWFQGALLHFRHVMSGMCTCIYYDLSFVFTVCSCLLRKQPILLQSNSKLKRMVGVSFFNKTVVVMHVIFSFCQHFKISSTHVLMKRRKQERMKGVHPTISSPSPKNSFLPVHSTKHAPSPSTFVV